MAFKELVPRKVSARETIKLTAMKRGGHALIISVDLAQRLKIAKGTKSKVMIDVDARPALLSVTSGAGPFVWGMLRGAAVLRLGVLPGVVTQNLKGLFCEWDEDGDEQNRSMITVEIPSIALRAPTQQPAIGGPASRQGDAAPASLIHQAAKRAGIR